MNRLHAYRGYLAAIGTTAAVMVLRHFVFVQTLSSLPLVMFVVPVVVATWMGGRWAGAFAVLLAAIGASYLYFGFDREPLVQPIYPVRLLAYFVVGTAVVFSVGSLRLSQQRLEAQKQALEEQIVERIQAEELLREANVRQRELLADLQRSEGRFRLAAEAVNAIIYDSDRLTGQVLRTRGLAEVLGYDSTEADSTVVWWHDLIHPEDRAEVLAEIDSALHETGRSVVEYRVRHRDGHYLWVVDRALGQRNDQGQLIRQVGSVQNITEIKDYQRALQNANRRKDEFLAMLAHELRNPLTAILHANSVSRESDSDSSAAQEMIDQQSRNLARLLDDLLDVSRIERDRVQLQSRTIESAEIVRRAVATVRPAVDERMHHLTVEISSLPMPLYADPMRIEQIIVNLLVNAVKYTPPGGSIRVTASPEGGEAVITIKDSGIGIAPAMLPRVFDLFAQADQTSEHAQGGLGIGLTVARKFAEVHHGCVVAMSDGIGRGSEFVLRLPLWNNVMTPATEIDEQSTGEPSLRVMVVEDNVNLADSTSELLRLSGHTVSTVHDGLMAVATAKAFEPDVILLDLGLPGLDGFQVAESLKSDSYFAGVRFIALSGYGQPSDRQRCDAAGFSDFLVKPVEFPTLLSVLSTTRPVKAG